MAGVGFDSGRATAEKREGKNGANSGQNKCSHTLNSEKPTKSGVSFSRAFSWMRTVPPAARRLIFPRSLPVIHRGSRSSSEPASRSDGPGRNSSRSASLMLASATTQAATSSFRSAERRPNTTASRTPANRSKCRFYFGRVNLLARDVDQIGDRGRRCEIRRPSDARRSSGMKLPAPSFSSSCSGK